MPTNERDYRKGSIDLSEPFDEFLAKEGLLAETEDAAIKEIVAKLIQGRIRAS